MFVSSAGCVSSPLNYRCRYNVPNLCTGNYVFLLQLGPTPLSYPVSASKCPRPTTRARLRAVRVFQNFGLRGCVSDLGYTDVERNDRPAMATLLLMLRLFLPINVTIGCTGRRNHDSVLLLPRRQVTNVARHVADRLGSAPLSAHPPMMTSRLRNQHQWRGQPSIHRYRPPRTTEVGLIL